MAVESDTVWQGKPAQILNVPAFLLAGAVAVGAVWAREPLAAALGPVVGDRMAGEAANYAAIGAVAVAVIWGIWRWIDLAAQRYRLTAQQLQIESGILNRRIEILELYRVKDITIVKPLLLRIFGLGSLELVSSDESRPEVILHGIPGPAELAPMVRERVEACRDAKGVREIDYT